MSDRRFSVGARVIIMPDTPAIVLRHGRDATGTYTEVQRDTGEVERVHRSMLRTPDATTAEPCSHSRKVITDWRDTDSDTTVFKYRCRDCQKTWEDEILGCRAVEHALAMKWERDFPIGTGR